MKIEKISDLMEWTRTLHQNLGECLNHCSTQNDAQRAKWLLEYLAGHQLKLSSMVQGFAENADPKVLGTWIYDYLERQPIDPHSACSEPYASMNFEQICESIFGLQNQVIVLYQGLVSRAPIPELDELLNRLVEFEEHETMRLAQQVNRIGDL